MEPHRQTLFVCLFSLCAAGSGGAQTMGAITGRVIDNSGAVLQGAQIQVQPLGVSVASDAEGDFALSGLPAGSYKITVSYVGFESFEKDVAVTAGEVLKLDVKMQVTSAKQEIIVTAERPRGEAEIINRERTADNILQVLPAEVITSLPNANVADALGRLPSVTLERIEGEGVYIQVRGTEPRLTNVTIDGISVPSPEPTVRQIRLDVLPADLVESVEVNKTLAPNMDGDGIGGSVNMKTKTAGEFPTVNLYGIGGWDPIMGGRYNDQFGGTVGHRFLRSKKLGILFGGSYDFNGRGIDNLQPAIDPASTFSKPIYDDNTIREYRYYRNRWGYAGSSDYKISDFSSIYVRGLYSNLQDYGDKWYYEPQATSAPKFYTSSKRPDASISSYTLGARKQFSSSLLSWEVSVSRAYELDSAGNPKADFSWIGSSLICGYNPVGQANPNIPHFGNGCDLAGSPLQVASNWGFKDITTSTGQSDQLNLTGSASYSTNYHVGSHYGIFEFGGKIRNGHKFQNATETVYDGWKAANYPMTQFLDSFSSSNYMSGNYFGGHYGPVSNFNQLQSFTLANLSSYVDGYKTASDTYPNIFDTIERISAGYIMNTMDFGKLHILAGVRFEGTQMDTLGYNVTLYPAGSGNCKTSTGCGVPVPVTNNPSYADALPSVSLRYALSGESALKAVYARGVSRPDIYQLVPYVTEDDSTNPATIAEGNPHLKPAHANNYDLLYERYLNPAGILQAGFFFKQINDTLISTSYTASSGPYQGDLVSQWINASNAELHGFEISYQQRLAMLPGRLGGFGMMANYSWTGSEIKSIPGRSDSPTLQRQAPNSWNISPTYDRGRLSIRVGLSYNGASIYQYEYQTASDPTGLGPKGPTGDVYTAAHLQLDTQGSFRIGHGLSAVVYGLNLTDEPLAYYNGSPIFVNQREWYKPTYAGGLRYSLNREK
ncbi:MAG: TonB-dependent receptor [Bryobacteraceae bacterium]